MNREIDMMREFSRADTSITRSVSDSTDFSGGHVERTTTKTMRETWERF